MLFKFNYIMAFLFERIDISDETSVIGDNHVHSIEFCQNALLLNNIYKYNNDM